MAEKLVYLSLIVEMIVTYTLGDLVNHCNLYGCTL